MPAVEYLALAGTPFTLPAHPGDTPDITDPRATQYIIAKEVRVFKATITKLTLAVTIREELKKQILKEKTQFFSVITLSLNRTKRPTLVLVDLRNPNMTT